MTTLSFRVYGIPVAKGSMRAFMHNGKPILTTSAKGLGEWTQKIAAAANGQTAQLESPAEAYIVFYMPKPKSARKKDTMPSKRPDLDKLVRAVLDALTGIAWNDDSQVVALRAYKEYASDTDPPGAKVEVQYYNDGGAR